MLRAMGTRGRLIAALTLGLCACTGAGAGTGTGTGTGETGNGDSQAGGGGSETDSGGGETGDTETGAGVECDVTLGDPPARASLEGVREALMPMRDQWRLVLDPGLKGEEFGYALPETDDQGWQVVDIDSSWEEQGHPDYDGVGWYRRWIDVPEGWEGSPVRLIASGIDDEYDLYVNGQWMSHKGEYPDRSVWGWKTHTRIDAGLEFGAPNLIAIRVNDWGGTGGIWREVVVRREVSLDDYRPYLPEVVLDDNPEFIDLYWRAWQVALNKLAFGTPENGFADAYMDEGFNEQIYQWDSSFIALFGRYGARVFPAMATLDNFYERQRPDGYIQRVYSETHGGEVGTPSDEEPMVNPPLFAWVEWRYYQTTGDDSRFERVLPILESYFEWLRDNVAASGVDGLYRQTDLGSGMDNTPRGDTHGSAWVDMSAQQALTARHLAYIAETLGDNERAQGWYEEHESLRERINAELWSDSEGFYFDRRSGGGHADTRHIGAFWPILAEVADEGQVDALVEHLLNPDEFYRPHLFPTLAASHPEYRESGHYWRGGVWAPTNYMLFDGLRLRGRHELASELARNHIGHMAAVLADPPQDLGRIAPEELDEDLATIWECYAPESSAPATRWDDTYYSRQDFVGWSGLGPIAMVIEGLLGFELHSPSKLVVWRPTRNDRHGIRNLQLGATNLVEIVASAREDDAALEFDTVANEGFTLRIERKGKELVELEVCAGEQHFVVD